MSNRRAGRLQVRWLIGAAAVVLVLVIVWALLVPGADWLARHDIGSAKGSLATARDAARGRLLTLGAGLLAAGALLFTARTFTRAREGQVTDRYTKAVEQLGSDKLDVRIGGIYALERVARDSAKDHPTVMEVLTAFIREHSREQWPPPDTGSSDQTGAGSPYGLPDNPPEQERLTRPDVQAAVTAVGRRDAKRDIGRINLASANLASAELTRANLTRANLTRANLTGADLYAARLTHARLTRANLTDADLTRANLSVANLTHAKLSGATLTDARFIEARLTDAKLDRAHLDGADLTRVDLTRADLTGAKLVGASWPEGAQVPEGWMVDGDSGRLKRAGQLSAAVPRGVVASARKSGAGCGAVACWGLGLVVVLGLPGLAVPGMMVRAARDAEPLWDKSPFISLALGPDPVGRFLLP